MGIVSKILSANIGNMSKSEKKDCSITIRITKSEKELIEQSARDNGISPSDYIRACILDKSTT